jgi:DNA-binding transcriptional ArsR family regulator
MKQPFEGLFGDTCETRLLQFLLPMYGIEFDMADLTEEIKLTRQSISKVMKKFSDRGMVKIRKDGRTWLYSINEESPLVKRLEDFDNSLIESMVGPGVLEPVLWKKQKAVHGSAQKKAMSGLMKMKLSFSQPGTKISGVASREAAYTAGKKPAGKKLIAR